MTQLHTITRLHDYTITRLHDYTITRLQLQLHTITNYKKSIYDAFTITRLHKLKSITA
jgi:hypothetical protein